MTTPSTDQVLSKALQKIIDTRFGYDGDYGVHKIAEDALYAAEQATERAAIQPAEAVAGIPTWKDRARYDKAQLFSPSDVVPYMEAELADLRNRLATPVAIQPAGDAVRDGWREKLKNIADWLKSSAQDQQVSPEEWAPASQFDYELQQASAEIESIISVCTKDCRGDCDLCRNWYERSNNAVANTTPAAPVASAPLWRCTLCDEQRRPGETCEDAACPVASAPAQPDAWMKERSDECVSDDRKSKMARAGFGVWDEVAAQYTRPLFFAAPAQLDGDAERLDFMFDQECSVENYELKAGTRYRVKWADSGEAQIDWYETPRAAIDAARAALATQQGDKHE